MMINPGTVYRLTLDALRSSLAKGGEPATAFASLAAKFEDEYGLDHDYFFPIMNRVSYDFERAYGGCR